MIETIPQYQTLVEMLTYWAQRQPDRTVFSFLQDGENDSVDWTYGELEQRAQTIAAKLQEITRPGQRAVLLYPPGLDYVAGFLGCLYAGVVAVPAYPPDPNRLERTLPRLQSIIQDCQSQVILTTEMIHSMASFVTAQAPDLAALEWIATDGLTPDNSWQAPDLSPDTLAFLQYTSGSTGEPKGVMLTHKNLLTNMKLIQEGFGLVLKQEVGVSWLPPYHDMGLIGGILENIYVGSTSILMSPLHFLQKPFRWLQTISNFKATVSGGPNFAYEMCARKIREEQKAQLDLSHWQVAFTGAEPILPETIKRFTQAFEGCGFSPKAFYPCYGLAEATLMVSGATRGRGVIQKTFSKKDYQGHSSESSQEQEVFLVGCGGGFQDVVIARPDTLTLCPDGEVGEILVQDPSVAQGYWNQKELSQKTFQAHLPGNGAGPFLRTGDLGFLDQGELYVTGRLKDLLIIRGKNYYPQDLERTVERCHRAFRPGCGAAFSVKVDWEEKLVLVQEADLSSDQEDALDYEALTQAIVKNISLEHELKVHEICLLKKGTIPKTSSGKIQRHACREAFLAKTLDPVYAYQASLKGSAATLREKSTQEVIESQGENLVSDPQSMQAWLIEKVCQYLDLNAQTLDPSQPFSEYGLDSKDAINLSGELEDQLGVRVSPTLMWKYPTLESLAGYLATQGKQEKSFLNEA